MLFGLYSIYDRVAGVYSAPFCAQKDAIAIRHFNATVSKTHIAFDCELYCLGSFDDNSGEIVGFEKPKFVVKYEVNAVE